VSEIRPLSDKLWPVFTKWLEAMLDEVTSLGDGVPKLYKFPHGHKRALETECQTSDMPTMVALSGLKQETQQKVKKLLYPSSWC